jgi:hypothetical protein
MSTELLRRLSVLLAVLVVVWLGLSVLRRARSDRAEELRIAGLDTAAVTAVLIARPGESVILAREGGGWTVNGQPAAPDLVAELLRQLGDTAARGELVAESAGSHGRLGLDSASAKRVTVRAGERELAGYLVGNRGSSWERVYVRLPGRDRAYELRSGVGEAVERQAEGWRDKTILRLSADSIGAVEVTRGRVRYTVSRADSVWVIGGQPADSGAVGRWLQQLTGLQASGFPSAEEAAGADFARPKRTLVIRDRGGRVLADLALDSVAAGFLVRKAGQSVVFRIDWWSADQVVPADSALRRGLP